MTKPTLVLRVGAVLLLLLSLARGAGGIVLILQGQDAVPDAKATDAALIAIGAGLLAVAVLGIFAALQIFRRNEGFFRIGVIALAAFVVDGLVNGMLLFGQPTDSGTLANVVAAALILGCLLLGRAGTPRARGGRRYAAPAGLVRHTIEGNRE